MWMKFCGNYVLSLDAVPEFNLGPKKKPSTKIEGILQPTSSEDKKKRTTSPRFGTICGRNLRFIRADSHFFV